MRAKGAERRGSGDMQLKTIPQMSGHAAGNALSLTLDSRVCHKYSDTIGKQNYQELGVEAELNFVFFERTIISLKLEICSMERGICPIAVFYIALKRSFFNI